MPLEVGELPYQADEVIAYGFPSTGDRLSITRGVVSRIEHTSYAHSGRSLREESRGREKLFVHHRLLDLLTQDANSFAPYR